MRLSRTTRNRYVLAPAILLLTAALVAGILSGTLSSLGRRGLYATGLLVDGGAPTLPPDAFASPATPRTPEPEPLGAPPAVLAPARPGPVPNAQKVAAKVKAVDREGVDGTFSGSVIDGGTGQRLYGSNETKAFIPASTLKVLTSTAALSILGPQHQFSTKVVSAGRGAITLVGGGDPYLTAERQATDPDRASLAALARLTADRLRKDRVGTVRLGYDTSLFSGPDWHPDWPAGYRDQVTPLTALWVNEGRVRGAVGARVADPAEVAAERFAVALRAEGVKVSSVAEKAATPKAPELAAVRSLPLDRIVEHLLMVSDNDAAEVLLRQSAIGAGQPGSFAAGRRVVQARLVKLGVWDETARLRDGSGLSRSNKVPADMLTKAIRLALQTARPELRAVVTGLPVAGVEGSLRVRFSGEGATAGRGLIRAKTGTLTQVSSLAGYVRTGDGTVLVYAFVANRATNYTGTRAWLDRVLSALSTCGCR